MTYAEIYGAGVSAAGNASPTIQVSTTLSTTGTDYSRVAAPTDRDEFLVSNNIWWDRAMAQRVAYAASGVSFSKQSPSNGASGLPTTVAVIWDAVPGATGYEVCIDQTPNNSCDTSWVATATPAYQTSLGDGTYSWQVRVTTPGGVTQANAGGWWAFTVGISPGAFAKISPANGASGLGSSVTLAWAALSSSTYQVCIDQIDDNSCNTSWQNASTPSATMNLANGSYYWQVRGQINGNWVLADSGFSWSFTVGTPPALFTKSAPFECGRERVESGLLQLGRRRGLHLSDLHRHEQQQQLRHVVAVGRVEFDERDAVARKLFVAGESASERSLGPR
jgi:hypothetical protein